MEKIGVSKLVEYRRIKKEGPKLTFIKNLRKPKLKTSSDGGDYWICCTSACAATFWNKDKAYLDAKIQELKDKIEESAHKQTKNQFQINIDIMFAMQDFDFDSISPQVELEKKSLKENIIKLHDLPVQVRPQHIFSYEIDEDAHIGGVWFVAKKGGYSDAEIGLFATTLYRYFTKRYSNKFTIDPGYCIAIDVSRAKEIRYSDILRGQTPDLLDSTIRELRKLLL